MASPSISGSETPIDCSAMRLDVMGDFHDP
jgi:hypothetical protein